MGKETVVVSLGGSILVPGEDDATYLRALADRVNRIAERVRLLLVAGGGRPARSYIETGRALGLDERTLDELGIVVTRLNARLLIHAIGPRAFPQVPESYAAAQEAVASHDVVVMGGQRPGLTTDGVAAELAEAVGARLLVNATSVEGVYERDPRDDPTARRYERLTYDDLRRITGEPTGRAGRTAVFDPYAVGVAARLGLRLVVVHGRDLDSLEGAIAGGGFTGTVVGG